MISRELDDVNLIIVNVTEGILSGAPDFNPQKMMSLLNIRYILVHEDTNWNFIEGHEWWVRSDLVYDDYLECMNNIGFPMAVKIGDLTIFENPLWDGGNYRQVDTIISIVGGFSAVNNLTLEPWFDPNHMGIVQIDSENNFNQGFANNYLYNTDKIVNSSPLGLNSNIPDIKYVSNSKREGMVSGEYHYLIMYEKYDDQWSISTSNGPISHMKMNIFMNGWIIENGTSENQKVVFTYEAQKLFTIGFIISLSSLSILLIILYCLVFIKKQSVIRNSDFIEIEMEEIDEFK